MADTDFWKQDKPAGEADRVRSLIAGPIGSTPEEHAQALASARADLDRTTNPEDRQLVQQQIDDMERSSAPDAAASAAPPSTAWWKQDRPAAQRDLPARVAPSSAGAGRGSVNPPAAGPANPPPPLGDMVSTVAAPAEPEPFDAGAGRGRINPPAVGEVPQREVGFLESAGRGWGRSGASTGKALTLAAAAPVVVAEKLKNLITGSDSTTAQDAMFRNLVDPTQNAIDWYALKPDEKQAFVGKVGDALGAMAQDLPLMIASGGAAAPELLALRNPTMARFIEHVTSRGFDAMRPIMIKAGTEKAQEVLDAGGSPTDAINSATTAALLTGFQGVMPMSAEGKALERFLTGIPVGPVQSEAARVVQNAADPTALHRDFDPADAAASAVTNAAASTVLPMVTGHAQPAPKPLDRIDLGYDPATGKKPVAAAVEAAYPAEPGSKPVQPGQAQPASEPAVPDIVARLDAIRPLRDRAQRLRTAGEKVVADELERRANTQAADVELQGMPDASETFQTHYRSLRVAGTAPAEAGTRAGMLDAFDRVAFEAGIPEQAVKAAIEKANAQPLDRVPGFLENYAQALAKRGIGQAPDPGEIARAVGDGGEVAMQRTLDTVYPQRIAPEHQQASDMLAAIDAGGVPLNPAKLRKVAEGLGLEVSQNAQPEETIARIRAAVERNSPAGAIDTGSDVRVTPEHDDVHQAATSPLSDIQEPSDAQKKAGNYRVGRMKIAGLDVSIENPQGSVRRGTSADGKAWETPMRDHYGYIRGTVGADKDHLDVFVKPGTPEAYRGPVYVIDQVDPASGKFDEHKVVMGASSADEAREQYLRNYEPGWQGLGAMTELPMPAFKAWAQSGKLKEPLGDIATTPDRRAAAPAAAPPSEPAPSRDDVAARVREQEPAPAAAAAEAKPTSGLKWEMRPSGTLAVRGDQVAIKEKLSAAGITKMAPMQGGIMVGKTQAEKARAALEGRAETAAIAKPLALGTAPGDAEPISVNRGIVHIGKHEAVNFNTGEPVRVPGDATADDVKAALKESGGLGRRQKFFGSELAAHEDFGAPMQARSDAFYSPLERQLEAIDANAMPGEGWSARIKGLINAGKVKADEVEWSGLTDWLKLQQGKVTKEQVQQFVRDNGVQVHEVTKDNEAHADETGEAARRRELDEMSDKDFSDEVENELGIGYQHGEDREDLIDEIIHAQERAYDSHDGAGEQSKTKYGQYTLPGGTNYREVLLTLPVKDAPSVKSDGFGGYMTTDEVGHVRYGATPEEAAQAGAQKHAAYRSGHWDEPNVLAHIRLNDRTDADGKKVLFVEELQSDWAQAGRKEGFVGDDRGLSPEQEKAIRDHYERVRNESARPILPATDDVTQMMRNMGTAEMRVAMKAAGLPEMSADGAHPASGAVPRAPFVGKTEAWLSLALKRIVKMAADEGYDRVAFVNGEQSADRYDLSKQVDRVSVNRAKDGGFSVSAHTKSDGVTRALGEAIPAEKLADYIGKDLAEKAAAIAPGRFAHYEGVDLKVGGEGMKSFYDKIVPTVANDVVKKLGGEGLTKINVDTQGRAEDGRGLSTKYRYEGPEYKSAELVHSDMRQKIDNATLEHQARDVASAVRGGESFATAMERNGSPALAEKLGGKMVERESVMSEQTGFDITHSMRDKVADGVPMMRRGDTPADGASVEKARAIVDAIIAKWKNGPAVHVVATAAELPGNQRNVRGFYQPGHVWVVAGAHRDAKDLRQTIGRTVAHEAIAHFGLREMLGREGWHQLMRNVELAVASGNKPMREIRDHVRKTYRHDDGSYVFEGRPALEADEIVAHAIERAIDEHGNFRPGLSFLKATWARIAQFLREHGIDVKFTDAELHGMLVQAARGLEDGRRTAGRSELTVAAARDDHAQSAQSRERREEGLPPGIAHIAAAADLKALKEHPDYKAAKAGDIPAAVNVVRDLVPEASLKTARESFGEGAIYAAPMAEEATGKNAIPKALAARYAASTGGHVDTEIIQANRAHHTGAGPMERMISRPVFDGDVQQGGRYVLVDDVSTMGGTLAELADHIRAGGGEVVGTVLLANTSRADTMTAAPSQVRKIEERYGEQVRQHFNVEPAALTAAEAGYVLGFRNAADLSATATAAARQRDSRLRAKGVQQAGQVKPDDFAPEKGMQARAATAPPEEKDLPAAAPGRSMIEGARDFASGILREGQMIAAPMGAGTEKARAIAQTFANNIRVARTQWLRMDDYIAKHFTEEQRKRMWDAADEENVERQRVDADPEYKRPADTGLARLSAVERATVERLHDYGEELLQRARDAGMFKGEGLPYWTPRMAVMIGGDGEFARIPGEGQKATNDGRGRNVTTTASSLKQRKYLTVGETERAASELAKSKGGQGAQVVRDIRTMPLAMARLERAIAGRELINQVKEIGLVTGRETTSTTGGQNFFTLDHPAFKEYRYRPDVALTEARDKNLWDGLAKFAEDLGVSHERVEKLRGRTWGYASTSGEIVTRFGGPETVLTHELGHQLDFKYGLADMLAKRGATAKELRALADLRFEGTETSDYFKRYVRRASEKIANMVHAYVHMPDRFKAIAPETFKAFEQFLDAHPELAGLRKIKPSLVLDSNAMRKRPPGEDFDVLPLFISKDFEGPLRAVLSNQDGEIYKGVMLLKSKSMSAIMFSPLIHNMVIWGRALAYSPTKVGSTYLYWKGHALAKDEAFVRQAVQDGLVPIGFNKATVMDATDIAGSVDKLGRWGDPNESWVSLAMQKAGNWIHAGVGDTTKKGLDAAGDFFHHTLLWKQIGALQWGIYADAKQHYMAKGLSEEAAGTLAAHFANRYAGVVAQENQGEIARKTLNLVLFSRSFNLTNVGLYRDALFGLPDGLKAKLYEAAPADAQRAVWIARRKAWRALALDLGFSMIATTLAQDLVDKLRGEKDVDEIKQGYIDRLKEMVEGVAARPGEIDSYNPYRLLSTYRNEPGKKDRVDMGADVGDRHQYMRLPTGKAIEDIIGWVEHPLDTASAKSSPLLKGVLQAMFDDKGFGVPVRDPNGGFMKTMWESVAHVVKSQTPADAVKQAYDIAQGHADDLDKKKLMGNVTGFTFSQGHPGGPEAEVAAKTNERFERSKKYTMQQVKDDLKRGDEDAALSKMEKIGMSSSEINAALARAESPKSGLSKAARKRFEQRSNDAEKREMEIQLGR